MSQRRLVILGTVLVLAVANGLILHKELALLQGRPVYLRLAPVDPRSLMQGDYMRLDYEVSRQVSGGTLPADGRLVLDFDGRGVARYRRVHAGEALAGGEFLLRYRKRDWQVRLGAESYFFQEGQAEKFSQARYAELRVTPSGDSVLVGLLDKHLQPLRP